MPTDVAPLGVPYVSRRVHIVPVGFETDRVVLPAQALKAEKVILLANLLKEDKASRFREAIIEKLAKVGIEHQVVRAPIFDLGRTLDVMVRLLRENSRDHLSINVSAGSKVQALAGCLAAMILRAEGIGVTAYYVEPDRYRENRPRKPLSFGVRQIIEVAPLVLPTPPEEVKVAMQLLSSREFSKLELALALTKYGQLDPSRVRQDGTPIDEKSRVSLQSAVDVRVVQPLVSMGYATAHKRGKRVVLSLTETGKQAAVLLTAGMGSVEG